jgi:RNA polymerase sigma factor (sigma-70 family)
MIDEKTINKIRESAFRTAYRMTRNSDYSDDIAQDICLRFIEATNSGNYVDTCKHTGWAARCAHNLVIDNKRKRCNTEFVELNDAAYCYSDFDIEIKDVEIDEIVNKLSIAQRDVIVCKYWGNKRYKDIATSNCISINTACSRGRQAMINLRKMLVMSD